MNYRFYSYLCLITTLLALLIFAYTHDYILINTGSRITAEQAAAIAYKKNVTLWLYKNQWIQEQVPLLITQESNNTLTQLITHWLDYAREEKKIKKTVLRSTSLTHDQTIAFISFDQTPWDASWNTFDKWMLIESMLKTVQAVPSLKKVFFLINEKPIDDTDLDFSNAWPINGFISS